MNELITIALLSIWMIYNIITKLTKKSKQDYNYVVSFAFIVGYLYFLLLDDLNSEIFPYYQYAVLIVFIFQLLITNIVGGSLKNNRGYDLSDLENELKQVKSASELLRMRFISTIEILPDGIAFKDDDGLVFGSDKFIEIFELENNQFSISDFESKIYKDDLPMYHQKIDKLSKKNPVYRMEYRVKNSDGLYWVKEVGKKIFLDKNYSIISIIKRMDIKQFPETEIDVLNNLPTYKLLYQEVQRLIRSKTPFHFIDIQLSNIPKINEKYGREVGDLMMGEYLSKLQYNFIKDNQSLFRISGIRFGMIIKDQNKYAVLERALIGGGDLLNLKMAFGGITQTLYPNLGITESPYEGKKADQVLDEAKEALTVSLDESTPDNYCFFKSL